MIISIAPPPLGPLFTVAKSQGFVRNSGCYRTTHAQTIKGLAFQLVDDVLDFTSTSVSLGKGSLSDIRHRKCLRISESRGKQDVLEWLKGLKNLR
uniref:Solanesyl diphosphate synthase 3, chloroplastic/mitochondrial isoform X2 n=1 Tax=Tanacetum cinerariifolium TaxID=118510 RepID=A0A6L2MAQ3_TANCI|nr:solanesyl diphosphate synthase 3, chloroplastic/mitochondrial isoform X2 [Tanacetum cinerariifolium]